jgi:hypothetical protein
MHSAQRAFSSSQRAAATWSERGAFSKSDDLSVDFSIGLEVNLEHLHSCQMSLSLAPRNVDLGSAKSSGLTKVPVGKTADGKSTRLKIEV